MSLADPCWKAGPFFPAHLTCSLPLKQNSFISKETFKEGWGVNQPISLKLCCKFLQVFHMPGQFQLSHNIFHKFLTHTHIYINKPKLYLPKNLSLLITRFGKVRYVLFLLLKIGGIYILMRLSWIFIMITRVVYVMLVWNAVTSFFLDRKKCLPNAENMI